MRCPGDEILRVFAREPVAGPKGAVGKHITSCPTCLKRLADLPGDKLAVAAPEAAKVAAEFTLVAPAAAKVAAEPAAVAEEPAEVAPAAAKVAPVVVAAKPPVVMPVPAPSPKPAVDKPAAAVQASRRRVWPWIVATGATGALVVAAVVVQTRRSDAGDPCGDAAERMAGVWDQARRAEIERAFMTTGKPNAAHAFQAVGSRLDDYTQQWVSKRGAVCEATRTSCFDAKLARVRAISDVLRTADAATVDRAVALSSTLAPLAACERGSPPAALFSELVGRAELESLLTRAEKVRALGITGKGSAAVGESDRVVERARALGDQPLLAEVLLVRAELAARLRDRDQSTARYREALEAARAGNHERAAAAAMIGLVRHGVDGELVGQAEALVSRIDGGGVLEGELRDAYGLVLETKGDLANARDQLTRAVAIREQVLGRQSPEVASSLAHLATVERKLGNHTRAVEVEVESIAILEKVFGADYPELVHHHATLATELELLGRYEDARTSARRSVEVSERALGPKHPETGNALYNLARIERFLGNLDGARELLERTRAVFARDARMLARVLSAEAGIHFDEGDYRAAEEVEARAFALEDKSLPAEHLQRARALHVTGTIKLMTNDLAAARTALEAGLAMREKLVGAEHLDVVMSLTWLAMLEERVGRTAQARTYATRAVELGGKALAAHDVHLGPALEIKGKLDTAADDLEGARAAYERVLAGVEKAFGSRKHAKAGVALVGLAEVSLRARDQAGAEALYEQALAALATEPTGGLHGQRRADAAMGLAQLLWKRPEQRTRARELIDAAIVSFQAGGPASARSLDAAQRWLRHHTPATASSSDTESPAAE